MTLAKAFFEPLGLWRLLLVNICVLCIKSLRFLLSSRAARAGHFAVNKGVEARDLAIRES